MRRWRALRCRWAARQYSSQATACLASPVTSASASDPPSWSPWSEAPLPDPSAAWFSPFHWSPSTDVASASTLPAAFYSSPSALSWERQRLFSSCWLHVGHVAQLPSVGSYFTSSFLSRPIVIVRGSDSVIRGFYNVCAHHAMAVASGSGCVSELRCPYHGWRYALDGRLTVATRVQGMREWRAADVRLQPIHIHVIGQLIFAYLPPAASASSSRSAQSTPASPPLPSTRHLQQLHDRLSPTGYAQLRHVHQASYELRCNWKVYCDNYLDGGQVHAPHSSCAAAGVWQLILRCLAWLSAVSGYHVKYAHPALAKELDLKKYSIDLLSEHLSLQSSPAATASAEVSLSPSASASAASSPPSPSSCLSSSSPSSSSRVSGTALYFFLYPTFMLNRYGSWLDTATVLPLSPTACRVVMDWWAQADMAEDEVRRGIESSEAVQTEDIALCEGVQRGLDSGVYTAGRYTTVERAMHAMHQTYYNQIVNDRQDHG